MTSRLSLLQASDQVGEVDAALAINGKLSAVIGLQPKLIWNATCKGVPVDR